MQPSAGSFGSRSVPNRPRVRPPRESVGDALGQASRYDRVVLKLSGEVFADTTTGSGIDAAVVQRIAEEVAAVNTELGVEIAVVVGGGNICRGMPGAERGMDRA